MSKYENPNAMMVQWLRDGIDGDPHSCIQRAITMGWTPDFTQGHEDHHAKAKAYLEKILERYEA